MTTDEINTILRECMEEVLTWPAWKLSDDVRAEFPKLHADHEAAQHGSLRGPGPIETFTDDRQQRSGEGKPHLVRDMIQRKKRRSPHG